MFGSSYLMGESQVQLDLRGGQYAGVRTSEKGGRLPCRGLPRRRSFAAEEL